MGVYRLSINIFWSGISLIDFDDSWFFLCLVNRIVKNIKIYFLCTNSCDKNTIT